MTSNRCYHHLLHREFDSILILRSQTPATLRLCQRYLATLSHYYWCKKNDELPAASEESRSVNETSIKSSIDQINANEDSKVLSMEFLGTPGTLDVQDRVGVANEQLSEDVGQGYRIPRLQYLFDLLGTLPSMAMAKVGLTAEEGVAITTIPSPPPAGPDDSKDGKPADSQPAGGGRWSSMMSSLDAITPARLQADIKPKIIVSTRSSVQDRVDSILRKVRTAESASSKSLRTAELARFLMDVPSAAGFALQKGALRTVTRMRDSTHDLGLEEQCNRCLSLMGCFQPVKHRRVNLLSLDGGGTRGLVALQLLEALESALGGPRIHEVFDYVVGVSTGAIIANLLIALKLTVKESRELYREIAVQLFSQNRFRGTTGLLFAHAYYDTDAWVRFLRKIVGEREMIDTITDPTSTKFSCVSSVVNRARVQAYLFRNYNPPPSRPSIYPGSARYLCWQAVQASGAAPGYFQEVILDGNVHQDGGILVNNPTAIGLHECRLLWPETPLGCIVSLGNGRVLSDLNVDHPGIAAKTPGYSSLKDKVLKIVDSASDTETIHSTLHDLLAGDVYFRFNPCMSEEFSLDENRTEYLDKMEAEGKMYVRKNWPKFVTAARAMTRPKTVMQRTRAFLGQQSIKHLDREMLG